jgi:Tol biopolymer transport system component
VVVQVDRSGREQVIVAKPGDYSAPRLSPDARRILVEMPDANRSRQMWVHDRSSGTNTQLTFDGQNTRGGWSPDGARIAFSTTRVQGKNYIWSMPSDGSDKGERVGSGSEVTSTAPASWTRDGKWIITDGVADGQTGLGPNGATREDIFAIPTSGSTRMMRPAVATPANEQVGEVSPDGKWIAYVADDAANYQVYVQPFLRPGGRVLISLGTASEPAWVSNDELTYVNRDADSMVVAHLQFGPTTTVTRTTLFDSRPYQLGGTSVRGYDVSRDGKSFLFVRPVGQRTAVEPIVVLNWAEEVRRLMSAAAAKP